MDDQPRTEELTEGAEVLEGIKARTGGKPKKGAPKARDLHPAATEWARALAAHFRLTMVITERNGDGTWRIEVDGAFQAQRGGPGTMPAWQRSTNHPTGSPEGMEAQGPSSIRSSRIASLARHGSTSPTASSPGTRPQPTTGTRGATCSGSQNDSTI